MTERYTKSHRHGPARPAVELLADLNRLREHYGVYPGIAADLAAAGRDLADRALRESSAQSRREAVAS
jgi:hypothetical protein